MKVGTDGVLLGAWAGKDCCAQDSALSILDVGTGSGLIALMLAQRFTKAHITAIEIDHDAATQAKENINRSVFKNRINVVEGDFKTYSPEQTFDLIVSNPPFFVTDARMKTETGRNIARHTDQLPFESLIEHSKECLNEKGRLSIVIPYSSSTDFISQAAMNSLYLTRKCDVRSNLTSEYKRSMLEFSNEIQDSKQTTLTLRDENNYFSMEYTELTKDFYL